MTYHYVSVMDGTRYGLLAGPYSTHEEALEMVPVVKELAQRVDPWAVFYAFGTAAAHGYNKPGVLNEMLEEANERG